MHRLLLAILVTILGVLACGFASLVTSHSVTAGEYYDGHYVTRGAVAEPSNCCYRKVVTYVRKVSYVRVAPRYRDGYDAPRYRSSYYAPPRRTVTYNEPYRDPYDDSRPYRYSDGAYDGRTPAYRVGYRDGYGEACSIRRVRVIGPYGGWVWAHARVCF